MAFKDHVKSVDDVSLWDETVEGNVWKTCRYLEQCLKNGITSNPKKFHFAQDNVEYVGFEVTNDPLQPLQAMLDSVRMSLSPTNITGVRFFFGLINQVSYAFSMRNNGPIQSFYWDERFQDKLSVKCLMSIGRHIWLQTGLCRGSVSVSALN